MHIRPATIQDAPAIQRIYAPYVHQTTITFDLEVPTITYFEQLIENVQTHLPFLVVELQNEIIGYTYAHPYKPRAAYNQTVETSIYIDQTKRQNGIGHALYQALEEALKARGIVNLLACITFPNPASIAFHHKLGYQQVAHFHQVGYKFEQWHDIIWMQKQLNNIPS